MIRVKAIKTKNYIQKTKLPDTDYVINPYGGCPHKCIYCYAEYMTRFSNHCEKWGDYLDVKVAENTINPEKYNGKKIVLSSVTDAYNPYERDYKITRHILEQLSGTTADITVLTKSDLILRDIDLFKKFKNITAAFSVNTVDDDFRKLIEPYASSSQRRITALEKLHNEGIRTVLFMAPIFPYITDVKEILLLTKDFVDEYWFENLNLRAGYKYRVLNMIKNYYPDYIKEYNAIYKYNDKGYWIYLGQEIENICHDLKIKSYKNYFYHEKIRKP